MLSRILVELLALVPRNLVLSQTTNVYAIGFFKYYPQWISLQPAAALVHTK